MPQALTGREKNDLFPSCNQKSFVDYSVTPELNAESSATFLKLHLLAEGMTAVIEKKGPPAVKVSARSAAPRGGRMPQTVLEQVIN